MLRNQNRHRNKLRRFTSILALSAMLSLEVLGPISTIVYADNTQTNQQSQAQQNQQQAKQQQAQQGQAQQGPIGQAHGIPLPANSGCINGRLSRDNLPRWPDGAVNYTIVAPGVDCCDGCHDDMLTKGECDGDCQDCSAYEDKWLKCTPQPDNTKVYEGELVSVENNNLNGNNFFYGGWINDQKGDVVHCKGSSKSFIDGAGNRVTIEDPCTYVHPVNPRQVRWLTVATLTDIQSYDNGDVILPKDKWKEVLTKMPELNTADILEYNYMIEDPDKYYRRPFRLTTTENPAFSLDQQDVYKQYMNYLIRHNIVNRDEVLNISDKVFWGSRNYNGGDSVYSALDRKYLKLPERYSQMNSLYAMSDFAADLSKTEEILYGRPLAIRMKYTRIDPLLNNIGISIEPIDSSPYRKYMGQLNIDSVQNDIMIDHSVYGELALATTNDVTEKYIKKLLQQGVISPSELTTGESREGKYYADEILGTLSEQQDTNKDINISDKVNASPAWELDDPIRINYDRNAMNKYEKLAEKVRQGYTKGAFVPNIGKKGSNPWGETYLYSFNGTPDVSGTWGEPFKPKHGRIVKKNNYIYDKDGFGYRFFKNERITYLDAIKLVARFIRITENEEKLTEEQVKELNSAYGLNLSSLTQDEAKDVHLLIAKGIIDGNDNDLVNASSQPFTYFKGIQMIYRVHNKDYRKAVIPQLSETDKEMLSKGYSKATINITKSSPKISKSVAASLSTIPISDTAKKAILNKTNQDKAIPDKITKSDIAYDYMYVGFPVDKENTNPHEDLRLITLDESRTVIDGADITVANSNRKWKLYKVHKSLSNNLQITGMYKGLPAYWTGMSGEGIYILDSPTKKEDNTVNKINLQRVLALKGSSEVKTTKDNDSVLLELVGNEMVERIWKDYSERVNTYTDSNTKQKEKEPIKVSKAHQQPTDKRSLFMVARNIILTPKGLQESQSDKQEPQLAKQQLDFLLGYSNRADLLNSNGTIKAGDKPTLEDTKVLVRTGIEPDKLQQLVFKGENFISKSKTGTNCAIISGENYCINEQVLDSSFKGRLTIQEDTVTKKANLIYDPIEGPTGAANVKFEKAIYLQGNNGESESIGGYAKFQSNGKPVALISKDELSKFGIIAKSDKVLYNQKTYQYAFIDTDDSMTLVGNNITHYPQDTIMVNTFGGKGKVFYNLNIISELISDTAAILASAGSQISMHIPEEKFTLLNVKDISYGGKNEEYSTIASTYVMDIMNQNKQLTGEKYMNMSALTGNASNFLYFKDKTPGKEINALIVYKPNTKRKLLNRDKSKTDNTLSTYLKAIDIPMSAIKKDEFIDTKNKILAALFIGASPNYKDVDLISGNYLYDIYLLTDGGEKANSDSLKNFLNLISKKDEVSLNNMKKAMSIEGFSSLDVKNDDADIKIKSLKVGKTHGNDIYQHDTSGNLYIRLVKTSDKNAPVANTQYIKDILYQNFRYVEVHPENYIAFRRYRFFEETPEGYIPLEVYGRNPSEYGRLERQDNRELYNFALYNHKKLIQDRKYYLPFFGKGINNTSIKVTDSKGKHIIGLGTKLETGYVKLKDEDVKKIIKETEATKIVDVLYKVAIENIKKHTGDYKLEEALGSAVVGYNPKRNITDKMQFMRGTWDGIGDIKATTSLKDFLDSPEMKRNSNNATHRLVFTMGQKYHAGIIKENLENPNVISITMKKVPETETLPDGSTRNKCERLLDSNGKEVLEPCQKDKNMATCSVCKKDRDGKPILIYKDIAESAEVDKNGNIHAFPVKNNTSGSLQTTLSEISRDLSTDKVELYMKPSIVIPAGTTIVDKDGNLEFLPASDVRDEIFYCADIVNALVARIRDKNGDKQRVYLSDIEKGAAVKLPDGGKFIKLSEPQKMGYGKVNWVDSYVLSKDSKINTNELDTYGLYDLFISQFANQRIPAKGGEGGNGAIRSIYFKQIIGKALARLPEEKDIIYLRGNAVASNHFKHYSPVALEKDGAEDSFSVKPFRMDYVSNQQRTDTEAGTDAYVGFKVFMPPTIEVELLPNEKVGNTNVYKILQYHDISKFQVDRDSSYVRYLRSKDTPAEEYDVILELLNNASLDGRAYKGRSLIDLSSIKDGSIIQILTRNIVPLVCIIMVSYICVMWVLLQINIFREWIDFIYMNFGINLLLPLGVGWIFQEIKLKYVLSELLMLGFIAVAFSSGTVEYTMLRITNAVISLM